MTQLSRALAAFIVIALITSPAGMAQEAPPPEHVLMDMQVWVVPSDGSGYCAQLEGGTLNVQLQALGQGQDGRGRPWPVAFTFYGYRGVDPAASIDTTISSLAATTVSTVVQGGSLYCFYLQNLVKVAPDAGNAERTQYWQGVNLRMAIQP